MARQLLGWLVHCLPNQQPSSLGPNYVLAAASLSGHQSPHFWSQGPTWEQHNRSLHPGRTYGTCAYSHHRCVRDTIYSMQLGALLAVWQLSRCSLLLVSALFNTWTWSGKPRFQSLEVVMLCWGQPGWVIWFICIWGLVKHATANGWKVEPALHQTGWRTTSPGAWKDGRALLHSLSRNPAEMSQSLKITEAKTVPFFFLPSSFPPFILETHYPHRRSSI